MTMRDTTYVDGKHGRVELIAIVGHGGAPRVIGGCRQKLRSAALYLNADGTAELHRDEQGVTVHVLTNARRLTAARLMDLWLGLA